MTIILDGECWHPIRVYHENSSIDINELPISENSKNRLIAWASEYCKYTAMTLEELTYVSEIIRTLDLEGMNILRVINEEWNGIDVDKFYYYSLCKGKLLLVVYSNGS